MAEPLFSDDALRILNSMSFDPEASHHYEHLAGGFLWSDELPVRDRAKWEVVSRDDLYRWIIYLRARITKGATHVEQVPLWQQLVQYAPYWPGLRPERQSDKMRRRLLAAERRAERCYERIRETG